MVSVNAVIRCGKERGWSKDCDVAVWGERRRCEQPMFCEEEHLASVVSIDCRRKYASIAISLLGRQPYIGLRQEHMPSTP